MIKISILLFFAPWCIAMDFPTTPLSTEEEPSMLDELFILNVLKQEDIPSIPKLENVNKDDASPVHSSSYLIFKNQCLYCEKLFKFKKDLYIHYTASHAEAKPFMCPHASCTKAFSIIGSLTSHIRQSHKETSKELSCMKVKEIAVTVSKKIKKIRCKYCKKKLCSSRELSLHIQRKHEQAYDHLCDYPECTSVYTTRKGLILHKLRKHRMPKFECSDCGQQFTLQGDLTQHIERKH